MHCALICLSVIMILDIRLKLRSLRVQLSKYLFTQRLIDIWIFIGYGKEEDPFMWRAFVIVVGGYDTFVFRKDQECTSQRTHIRQLDLNTAFKVFIWNWIRQGQISLFIMRPRQIDSFMNLAAESCFVHERGRGKLFCSWMWPRKVVLFMNMAAESCFVHERGRGKLLCSWIWPRKVGLFMNVAEESWFVHEYDRGKLVC
jgi:hypothetical protein